MKAGALNAPSLFEILKNAEVSTYSLEQTADIIGRDIARETNTRPSKYRLSQIKGLTITQLNYLLLVSAFSVVLLIDDKNGLAGLPEWLFWFGALLAPLHLAKSPILWWFSILFRLPKLLLYKRKALTWHILKLPLMTDAEVQRLKDVAKLLPPDTQTNFCEVGTLEYFFIEVEVDAPYPEHRAIIHVGVCGAKGKARGMLIPPESQF